jgi:hypothetical protein
MNVLFPEIHAAFVNACRKRRDRGSNPGYPCGRSGFQDLAGFDTRVVEAKSYESSYFGRCRQ